MQLQALSTHNVWDSFFKVCLLR
uniref:Uncharacterized protein n=1 Tax=Anguilla anguilla TaxID=7936 RepID=A0A0E9RP08_ANGAN